jgi:acetyl-CoA C-acetyltransferase
LPFFGGAGNNYSAHAIAEAVQRVRADRGSYALVGANGGWMSKYATGVYSTDPADWGGNDRFAVLPKATDKVPFAKGPVGVAVVETYTINRGPKGAEAIFIGRSDAGERVVGNADLTDAATSQAFESGEPFGKRLTLTQDERGRVLGRVTA